MNIQFVRFNLTFYAILFIFFYNILFTVFASALPPEREMEERAWKAVFLTTLSRPVDIVDGVIDGPFSCVGTYKYLARERDWTFFVLDGDGELRLFNPSVDEGESIRGINVEQLTADGNSVAVASAHSLSLLGRAGHMMYYLLQQLTDTSIAANPWPRRVKVFRPQDGYQWGKLSINTSGSLSACKRDGSGDPALLRVSTGHSHAIPSTQSIIELRRAISTTVEMLRRVDPEVDISLPEQTPIRSFMAPSDFGTGELMLSTDGGVRIFKEGTPAVNPVIGVLEHEDQGIALMDDLRTLRSQSIVVWSAFLNIVRKLA